MFNSFFRSPMTTFVINNVVPYSLYEGPPTRQEQKQQLAEATLWLARAQGRDDARAARRLIDLLLLDLGPLYPGHNGRTRSSLSHGYTAPQKKLRLTRAKYRR